MSIQLNYAPVKMFLEENISSEEPCGDNLDFIIFWLKTLPPIKEYGWIAGGMWRRYVQNIPVAGDDCDIDFFFYNEDKRQEYISLLEHHLTKYHIKLQEVTELSVLDENAPSYEFIKRQKQQQNGTSFYNIEYIINFPNDPIREQRFKTKFQLIGYVFPESPEILLDNFDFTLCQFCSDGERVWWGPTSLSDVKTKNLKVHKISVPTDSMRRILKYTKQGFNQNAQLYADFISQVYVYSPPNTITPTLAKNFYNISQKEIDQFNKNVEMAVERYANYDSTNSNLH